MNRKPKTSPEKEQKPKTIGVEAKEKAHEAPKTSSEKPKQTPEQIQKRIKKEKREARERRIKHNKLCKEWMEQNWPHLFAQDIEIRPLQVGIRNLIIQKHIEQGGRQALGFPRHKPVSHYLGKWTKQTAYLEALAKEGAQRYDTDGNPCGLVSDADRETAQAWLEQRNQSKKQS